MLSHSRGRRGRDHMVVGITITYAIGAYHHLRCALEARSGEVHSIQHYVIKFVSDLRHDITEILLKVALSTITLTLHICIVYGLRMCKLLLENW